MDDEVQAYLDAVAGERRRRDARTLTELMQRVTGLEPQLWRAGIVAFGSYHYKYDSGREGDAPAAGFAPRKAASVVYLPDGVGAHADLLERLGPHTTGVGCLYLKDLGEVDLDVLETILARSFAEVSKGDFPDRARDSG